MEEKRNTKRFVEDINGSFSFHDSQDPDTIRSIPFEVIDISLHGAKITASQYLPVFSNIRISLNLTAPVQVIKLHARVVWIKKKDSEDTFKIGVEFFHDMNTLENLQKHLYGN